VFVSFSLLQVFAVGKDLNKGSELLLLLLLRDRSAVFELIITNILVLSFRGILHETFSYMRKLKLKL
jgi:hypothetical protein